MATAQPNVHFRWIGSNKHVATAPVNFVIPKSTEFLQSWLAPQLGLAPKKWGQVTVYSGKYRLTNDVLLGVPADSSCSDGGMGTSAAWKSFRQHAKTATQDLVLHVTRCSEADCNAARSLAVIRDYNNADLQALLKKYANNVAFMVNAVLHWPIVFKHAPKSMQKNELFAAAAVFSSKDNAPLIDPDLWTKPSFVIRAARKKAHTGTVLKYCSNAVKKCHKTMLCLINIDAAYCDDAVVHNDFDLLVKASAMYSMCFWYLKDVETATKVAKALPCGSYAKKYFESMLRLGLEPHIKLS